MGEVDRIQDYKQQREQLVFGLINVFPQKL